jgi:hypothetical protein
VEFIAAQFVRLGCCCVGCFVVTYEVLWIGFGFRVLVLLLVLLVLGRFWFVWDGVGLAK